MNTPLANPSNTSFEKPVVNTERKVNPIISNAIEFLTIFTLWGVVSTCVLLLSLTWV